ncbi:MAG: hypothetical protein ABSA15_05500 [Thermoplasmata archaeon]|jgi:hypothetical protein
MANSAPPNVEARLRGMEREIQALKERIVELEKSAAERGEHPVDQKVVRSKVTYDWQA